MEMRLPDRLTVLLLLGALLASCTPAQEGKEGESRALDLPRLIDLGSTQCTPCKRMAPIIERLKQDYAGIVNIEFIDIRKDAAAGMVHAIRIIPTQVFLDSAGNEVFRHEGFFSRQEIEAVFRDSQGIAILPRAEGGDSTAPAPGDSVGAEGESESFHIEGTI
jgi:thioredoxin 1